MKYIEAKQEIISWLLHIADKFGIKRNDLIEIVESIIQDIKQND